LKIAVIGSGITGLGAALALSETADVTLFEADGRLGGHANTVDAIFGDRQIAVDTGFIVYNYRNYPNLTGLFDFLGVPTKWSDMSFGFSLNSGAMEYACDNIDKVFAQRRNALNPRYVLMFRDVLRFCKLAPADLSAGTINGASLGEWVARYGFSAWFRERFILPMGAAIWSTPSRRVMEFPAENFLRFFANHDLYTGLGDAMKWRTVDGGSRVYVARVAERLGSRAVTGARAVSVSRAGPRPVVRFADGHEASFDQVILACHGPQARALLTDADGQEASLLDCFRVSQNRAVLHSDPRLMPVRRKVWSSWNLMSRGAADEGKPVAVSYWMNRLQSIDPACPLFVTLNPHVEPDPALVHAEFDYAHPLYDRAAFDAQSGLDAVQGRGGVWYAGAWLGYGFHEDGLRAGLRVAAALGARAPWMRDTGAPLSRPAAVEAA
jgi:predicted NAD/FAD-binding protein